MHHYCLIRDNSSKKSIEFHTYFKSSVDPAFELIFGITNVRSLELLLVIIIELSFENIFDFFIQYSRLRIEATPIKLPQDAESATRIHRMEILNIVREETLKSHARSVKKLLKM